jgi:predicted lipoprotein with Yx(FWY)xxD motif
MRVLSILVLAAVLAVAGCSGGDDEPPAAAREQSTATVDAAEQPAATAEAPTQGEGAGRTAKAPPKDKGAARERNGTRIKVGPSDFGRMLFDSRNQAIYIFENDSEDESVCYGECAEAWPPVFADGRPVAGKGVDADLLGTLERRNGRRQVTYAGRPLYYYAHEAPGEVRCHNVNLNGGFWWVVGPDGERRP